MKIKYLLAVLISMLVSPVMANTAKPYEFIGWIDAVAGNQKGPQYELSTKILLDMSQVTNFDMKKNSIDAVKVNGYFYSKGGDLIFKITKIEKESSTEIESDSFDDKGYDEAY